MDPYLYLDPILYFRPMEQDELRIRRGLRLRAWS